MVAPVAIVPFTFQRYEGEEPPLMLVELKMTEEPEHTGFMEGVIDTLTGRSGLTTMVTTFEPAGVPVAQVASEVKTQLIASLLSGV